MPPGAVVGPPPEFTKITVPRIQVNPYLPSIQQILSDVMIEEYLAEERRGL